MEAGRDARRGSDRSRRDDLWLFFPFLAIVLCYAPVWLTEYGFAEDYRLLSLFDHGATNRTLMIAEGRPVAALWTNLVHAHLSGIESLAMLRLANVALLGVAAVLLATAWRRGGLAGREAALAGAAVFTLPPFQITAATAAFTMIPPALVLSILAALLAARAAAQDRLSARSAELFLSFVLLALAMTAYQPAAMMFWAVAGLLLLLPEHEPRPFRRLMVGFLAVGFAAVVAGFAAYVIGKSIWPAELAGQGRARLSLNPIQKGLWFISNPLVQSLNLWRLYPDRLLALAVALGLEAGLAIQLVRRTHGRLQFAVALALVPLCYLPNLVVVEDWAAFRTQIALVAVVFIYGVISLGRLRSVAPRWIFPALLTCITAMGLGLAATNVWRLCAVPQARELAMVRGRVAGLSPAYRSIGVVMAGATQTFAPYSLWDEFGRMAVSFPWGVASLPYLALRELRPGVDTSAIRVYDLARDTVKVDTVLDWGRIMREERSADPR